ncbi:MAG TPA: HPr kinase/phosphorylase, partial [Gallionella sp.]|nr:HPr kinase/phosphorylase [Gallionella sp.]
MSQINVRQLFEDKQQRLQLSRVAGTDGTNRIIDSDKVNDSNSELIGHLNLIHPNWVQVLSETELNYLRNLSTEERDSAFRQIEQSITTCLIVAGTDNIPAELIDFANRSYIPLFCSPKSSVRL